MALRVTLLECIDGEVARLWILEEAGIGGEKVLLPSQFVEATEYPVNIDGANDPASEK